MSAVRIDFVERVKEYLAAFNRCDFAAIRDQHLSEAIVVEVDGKVVAQDRDLILLSYQKDFDAGKTVRLTSQPCLVADRVVQVRLEAIAGDIKTQLTVRYQYDDKGLQSRHLISDVRVVKDFVLPQ